MSISLSRTADFEGLDSTAQSLGDAGVREVFPSLWALALVVLAAVILGYIIAQVVRWFGGRGGQRDDPDSRSNGDNASGFVISAILLMTAMLLVSFLFFTSAGSAVPTSLDLQDVGVFIAGFSLVLPAIFYAGWLAANVDRNEAELRSGQNQLRNRLNRLQEKLNQVKEDQLTRKVEAFTEGHEQDFIREAGAKAEAEEAPNGGNDDD